jgi:hypothetical protein
MVREIRWQARVTGRGAFTEAPVYWTLHMAVTAAINLESIASILRAEPAIVSSCAELALVRSSMCISLEQHRCPGPWRSGGSIGQGGAEQEALHAFRLRCPLWAHTWDTWP